MRAISLLLLPSSFNVFIVVYIAHPTTLPSLNLLQGEYHFWFISGWCSYGIFGSATSGIYCAIEGHTDRFVDKPPHEVYATLLDEGQYHCSIRTMYRILDANKEVKERRNQLSHPAYQKPELLATGANEVWSWDITKLLRMPLGIANYSDY